MIKFKHRDFDSFTLLVENLINIDEVKHFSRNNCNSKLLNLDLFKDIITDIKYLIDLELIDFLYINFNSIPSSEKKLYIDKVVEVIEYFYSKEGISIDVRKNLDSDLDNNVDYFYVDTLIMFIKITSKHKNSIVYLNETFKNLNNLIKYKNTR